MAKTKGFLNKEAHEPINKGSSQGRNPSLQKMNKKKRGRTKKQKIQRTRKMKRKKIYCNKLIMNRY